MTKARNGNKNNNENKDGDACFMFMICLVSLRTLFYCILYSVFCFLFSERIQTDPRHERTTLRQTQVIIVPFCDFFDTFQAYEGVIQAINLARKNARDLVTDASIEKMELMEREWEYVKRKHACVLCFSYLLLCLFLTKRPVIVLILICNSVSINGASLHPCYGEKTPKEIIDELEEIEEDGMLDLNKVEGMRRRNQARRSPYPTLIIEVQASPPGENDINDRKSPPQSASDDDDNDLSRRGVLNDIVLKLESIFAKSAAIHKKNDIKEENSEDSFYKAIGRVSLHTLLFLCRLRVSKHSKCYSPHLIIPLLISS